MATGARLVSGAERETLRAGAEVPTRLPRLAQP
ncbi:hypothetical protein FHX82_004773 [Amycolatopsis bartoniae]|nr:hypothetical protein [Amycolatopsis bartoniae]